MTKKKSKIQMPKILSLLNNLDSIDAIIKTILPINTNMIIEAYKNFTFENIRYECVILFKELTDKEIEDKVYENSKQKTTLGMLLNTIPIGSIIINARCINWKNQEFIMIAIKAQ